MFSNGIISYICLYHALRSFQRELTCGKMGITSVERLRCLDIIQQISYARTENEYQFHVEKLKATKLNSVVNYFTEISILDVWLGSGTQLKTNGFLISKS